MKIVQDSIQDLKENFYPLKNSFLYDETGEVAVKANPWFIVRKFEYTQDDDFDIKKMYEIFSPDTDINGKLYEVEWGTCLTELIDLFRHRTFTAGEYGVIHQTDIGPISLGEKRLKAFIKEVSKFVELPPKKVYGYKPSGDAELFKSITPWRFCFVFLNAGEGLVFAGIIEP